jgi:hypothetical protein
MVKTLFVFRCQLFDKDIYVYSVSPDTVQELIKEGALITCRRFYEEGFEDATEQARRLITENRTQELMHSFF